MIILKILPLVFLSLHAAVANAQSRAGELSTEPGTFVWRQTQTRGNADWNERSNNIQKLARTPGWYFDKFLINDHKKTWAPWQNMELDNVFVPKAELVGRYKALPGSSDAKLTFESIIGEKAGSMVRATDLEIFSQRYSMRISDFWRRETRLKNFTALGDLSSACPFCQMVDPIPASGTLDVYGVDHEFKHLRGGALVLDAPKKEQVTLTKSAKTDSSSIREYLRIYECSATVKSLRKPLDIGGNYTTSPFFDRQCLSIDGPNSTAIAALSKKQRKDGEVCFNLYSKFDQKCLYGETNSQLDEIVKYSGIIVAFLGGERMQIRCTAVAIATDVIVTARHCLLRIGLVPPKDQNEKDLLPLAFIPFVFADDVKFQTYPEVGFPIVAEIYDDSRDMPLSFPSSYLADQPPVEKDLVVLRLGTANGFSAGLGAVLQFPPPFGIKNKVKNGTNLSLIGNQEFVRRAIAIKSRLNGSDMPSYETLIMTGEWRSIFRVVNGGVCKSLGSDAVSFGHFCQTYPGTSGAPIFAPNELGTGFDLVGVQSAGTPNVEHLQPSNVAAAIVRARHPVIDSLLAAR